MKLFLRMLFPAVLTAALLTGCEKKTPCTITVRNITGYSICSLELTQESDNSSHTEWMAEDWLDDGEERQLKLGKFTEQELAEGFFALVRLADDAGSEEDFSSLMLYDGGVLTFYVDDLSISAAYNQTDEEIEAMIRDVHESLQTEPDAAENAAE